MAKVSEKDIAKRWDERVVPNGWHELGAAGARAYLEKYGRNISMDKANALAEYARQRGYDEFADGIEANA